MQKLFFHLACALVLLLPGAAFAAFTIYDHDTYDYQTLGVPKFVDVNYIDLRRITQISKFRSNAGHEYSDATQFSTEAIAGVNMPVERCSSMKHYFIAPDETVKIYSPVAGVVSRRFEEGIGGTQIQITSDVQGAFTFIMFHVELTGGDFPEGTHVAAGQFLGHHTGKQTFSDMAVIVHAPKGYHLVSYFETLTDAAFAQFQARGVRSRDQLIHSRAERDAAPFTCAGTTFVNNKVPEDQDYFTLTGGAATQTLTAPAAFTGYQHIGDAPYTFTASASSGLPVSLTSDSPKACAVNGMTVAFRRPGLCSMTLSQPGNDDIFPATPSHYTFYVTRAGELPYGGTVRFGGVFPPGSGATQSLIRVYNESTVAAPLILDLLDGDTGTTVATWTSPAIPAQRERQFTITDIENAAPAGFKRPSVYGLKVKTGSVNGYLQHVLFNGTTATLTNATSCVAGLVTTPLHQMGIHTSLMTGYPSTLVFANALGVPGIFATIELDNADNGIYIGIAPVTEQPNHGAVSPHAQWTSTVAAIETAAKYTPTSLHYALRPYNYGFPTGVTMNLVNNSAAGVIADMTANCSILGGGLATVLTPTMVPNVFSGSNTTAQSMIRIYNAGDTAGPAVITLHDPDYGTAIGQWTTPAIPAGSEQQFAMGAVEATIGLQNHSIYTVSVDAQFDGLVQHVTWKKPGAPLMNSSTCIGATTVEPKTAIAVHSALVAAAGYPSTVIVNNTGDAAAAATIGVYDAATGARLGRFTTAPIPKDAQAVFDSQALETRGGFSGAGKLHYVVKLEGDYTGSLQHYVTSNGVVSDMTLVCGM